MRIKILFAFVWSSLFFNYLYGQHTISDQLYIYPSGMGNSHIPNSSGDIYLTGYSGTGSGDFIYRIYDGTTYSNRFRISSEGKVGIGTSNPSSNLEILGSNVSLPILGLKNGSWLCNQEMAIEFWNGSYYKTVPTSRIVSKMHGCGNGGEDLHFQTQSYSSINPNQEFPTTKMVIENDGNVGIGFTNPKYKLSVNGIVSATEVKVSTTPNSDYVFEPDYNLKSLNEVDQFIKENKHLPDIPSSKEFKENGVGLGEMDDMLLRKVEELTLYVIELNEKLEVRSSKLEALEKENEALKTRLGKLEAEK